MYLLSYSYSTSCLLILPTAPIHRYVDYIFHIHTIILSGSVLCLLFVRNAFSNQTGHICNYYILIHSLFHGAWMERAWMRFLHEISIPSLCLRDLIPWVHTLCIRFGADQEIDSHSRRLSDCFGAKGLLEFFPNFGRIVAPSSVTPRHSARPLSRTTSCKGMEAQSGVDKVGQLWRTG